MTRNDAIELARTHATRVPGVPYHEYQPAPELAKDWLPHEWVIEAIQDAYELGQAVPTLDELGWL